MSRARRFRPDYLRYADLHRCAPAAQVLFAGLLNNCDDEGRISSSADYLAYELYPHEITWPGTAELIASIPAWLHILEAGGLIQTYNHTVAVVGWPERYLAERIDHPRLSKLPPPPMPKAVPTQIGFDLTGNEMDDARRRRQLVDKSGDKR